MQVSLTVIAPWITGACSTKTPPGSCLFNISHLRALQMTFWSMCTTSLAIANNLATYAVSLEESKSQQNLWVWIKLRSLRHTDKKKYKHPLPSATWTIDPCAVGSVTFTIRQLLIVTCQAKHLRKWKFDVFVIQTLAKCENGFETSRFIFSNKMN